MENFKQVFEYLKDADLKLNPKKYFFFKQKLPFLGHIISKKGIKTDLSKIQAIHNYSISQNTTEL